MTLTFLRNVGDQLNRFNDFFGLTFERFRGICRIIDSLVQPFDGFNCFRDNRFTGLREFGGLLRGFSGLLVATRCVN
ncbi:hypothetical protein [Paenibacillus terrae]|uniref:hypothetical protein n=1 Tax=Paenibacillus terrae TaxID=159743 RepID=UPI0013051239|nr:hypothetical protein [Paenibacillus terrae]